MNMYKPHGSMQRANKDIIHKLLHFLKGLSSSWSLGTYFGSVPGSQPCAATERSQSSQSA